MKKIASSTITVPRLFTERLFIVLHS